MGDQMPDASVPSTEIQDFIAVWCTTLSQVLEQIAGKSFIIQPVLETDENLASQEIGLQMIVTAGGALRGEMSFAMPAAVGIALAQMFVGEAGETTTGITADQKEAIEELFRQIAGQVATSLRSRWGEVQLGIESGKVPTWSLSSGGWVGSAAEAPFPVRLQWTLSAALSAALAASSATSADDGAASSQRYQAVAANVEEGKLSLLMDVELEVTLRFGGRTLPLSEILGLMPGAVVELDRAIQEPADLLLDGRLIARGEVVVVQGNYGLRVTEVMASPPTPS